MTAEAAVAAYGWGEVSNLVRHLPDDSATWRALHPDEAPWASRLATVRVLADICDTVSGFAWLFATANSQSKPKHPAPYPVPWAKGKPKRLGSAPIAVADFDAWYYGGE